MVPLTSIIVKEITQKHNYRRHVSPEKYYIVYIKCSNLFVKY